MKKRIVSLLLVFMLSLSLIVSAYAAEVPKEETVSPAGIVTGSLPLNTALRFVPYLYQTQSLNILVSSTSQIANNKDVTTWPTDYSDPVQLWQVRSYSDGSYRIVSNAAPGYALEYYWGNSNPYNADVYWYNIVDNSESNAADCALDVTLGSSNQWRFKLRYHNTLWLATDSATRTVSGTTIHNVYWAPYSSVTLNDMSWHVYS